MNHFYCSICPQIAQKDTDKPLCEHPKIIPVKIELNLLKRKVRPYWCPYIHCNLMEYQLESKLNELV